MLRRLRPNQPGTPGTTPATPPPTPQVPAAAIPADPASSAGRLARLGDILLTERIITAKQLEEGLAKKRESGGFLGQALVDLGHIDQDTLTLVLVKQCKIPHLNLHDYNISREVLALMPAELCGKYHVLPVDKMGKILTVAMVDPLDVEALSAVRAAFPDLRIKPILCDWPHYQEVFQRMVPVKRPVPAESPAPVLEVAQAVPAEPIAPVSVADAAPSPKPAASEPVAIPVSAAPAIDTASISAAIREGVRETVAQFEQKLAEASELLRTIQTSERRMVESHAKQDLGLVPAQAPRHSGRVADLAPVAGRPGPGADNDAGVLNQLERGAAGPSHSFATFFAGAVNKATLEMAKAATIGSGAEYNPLFVCGDVGLGKTHLISAIGNAMLARAPQLRVGWTSAGRFADHAVAALEEKAQEEFRRAYSQWDALILDDIQFLGGRIEAQEELFHVFNALQERGRKIVIAGDRPPEKLGLLEKRLISRFDSGQLVRVHAPEWETRLQILQHHAKQLEVAAPDDVLAMIAMRYPSDVRRLIGALRKVAARAKLQGGKMTAALAGDVLAESSAEAAA